MSGTELVTDVTNRINSRISQNVSMHNNLAISTPKKKNFITLAIGNVNDYRIGVDVFLP